MSRPAEAGKRSLLFDGGFEGPSNVQVAAPLPCERDFGMETKFVADSMLGRLCKWLRIMGYDTHYQPRYGAGMVKDLVMEGRKLLSRYQPTIDLYPDSMLIRSDQVKDQLHEMGDKGLLIPDRSKWFSRCLICNVPLKEAEASEARENVPEYVFYQNTPEIRFCSSCGRYFWPGSHRERMVRQLEAWGF